MAAISIVERKRPSSKSSAHSAGVSSGALTANPRTSLRAQLVAVEALYASVT